MTGSTWKIEEQGVFLRTFWNISPDNMFVVQIMDDERVLLEGINPALSAYMGIPAEQLQGTFLDEIFPPEVHKRLQGNYLRCIQTGKTISYEEEGKPESRTYWHTLLVPIPGEDGAFHRVFGISRETTALKQAYDTINRSNQMLEEEVEKRTCELKEALDQIVTLAETDPLTGLYNRRKFTELAEAEIARSHRFCHPFVLIMIDIDHFKLVNDTYGHDAGDAALQQFAKILTDNLRKVDAVARWGGEEFIILAREITRDQALALGERIRTCISNHAFSAGFHITVSMGISDLAPFDSLDTLIKHADHALYQAKQSGRNRAVFEAVPPVG
ncbi:MAG TPA: diguanylate cyclase [Anaerolineaceae bacterium]|nr:diguanylate cyclase [Anaerolineaceae bacterium]HPN53031.1 diguanylate cyclase [Anaerolineaceae bacterium]